MVGATIFNHMVDQLGEKVLSEVLKAVSDATRRSLLTQLIQQGPTRVTDLASYYDMSLNAISKHIKVLEKAGLVSRKTLGRVHWIEANLGPVEHVERWFTQLKSIWALRLDKLDAVLNNGENDDG
jgi:DNA-binding transcriptional ArsR family regulator